MTRVQFLAGAMMGFFLFAVTVSRLALVHEANHPPSSSSKVKNAWIYTSTPQCVFMAWCL